VHILCNKLKENEIYAALSVNPVSKLKKGDQPYKIVMLCKGVKS